MFSLKEYIKGGLIKAVGNMADYQIILNSAGWLEKGVLTEDDLMEIQAAIDAKNAKYESDTDEIVESIEPETESAESTETE